MLQTRLILPDGARAELTALVRSAQPKAARRAFVILSAADGMSNYEIARRTGMTRRNVIALRERFGNRGVSAVAHDARRAGRPRTIPPAVVESIVDESLNTIPRLAPHWSARCMAARFAVSPATVHRIWAVNGIEPRSVDTLRFSNGPAFAAFVDDVVGVYRDARRKALAVSVRAEHAAEPLGGASSFTHERLAALFDALAALEAAAPASTVARGCNARFLTFLKNVCGNVAAPSEIHIIADGNALHPRSAAAAWLATRPSVSVHHASPGSDWLELVERFLREVMTSSTARSAFDTVADVVRAVERRLSERPPKSFSWSR